MKKPRPFGKYYLLERINVGGMAEVFKAKSFGSDGFEKIVAIKRILPNIAEDEEFITMFKDEAKISVRLNHPNIAQIIDLNKVDDIYYIAMEYVHGKDIRTIFERCRTDRQPMSIAQACFLIMKVCEGLEYAHALKDANGHEVGLVHRDISPQNVLISYEGDVKIIDFGIAKAAGKASKTQAGILKGKFGYMSPEQVRGLPLDRRSDIFSLGIVLYELLTGERLFIGESDFSTLEKVRNVEILPPSTYNRKIPEQLESIVLRALAKEVEDRYQTAGDFHEELQAFMYTSGEFYSRKDLAVWMKKVFVTELREEQSKLEQYAKIKLPPELKSQQPPVANNSFFDAPTIQPDMVPASSKSDNEDWWEDDEIETALYDKPEDMVEAQDNPLDFFSADDSALGNQVPADEPELVINNGRNAGVVASAAAMGMQIPNQFSEDVPPQSQQNLGSAKKSGNGMLIGITLVACAVLATFLVWFFVFRTTGTKKGTLIVRPTPQKGVAIKLYDANNKPLRTNNKIPLKVDLKPGKYIVVVGGDGFESIKKVINIHSSSEKDLSIELKKVKIVSDKFKLSIDGEPKGATVWLNGKEYADKTPWNGMEILAGKVKVEIGFGNQFHKYSVSYTKKADETLKIKYSLVPKKITLNLKVSTPRAKVCIVNSLDVAPKRKQCRINPRKPYVLEPVQGKEYYLMVTKLNYSPYIEKIDVTGKIIWSPKKPIRLFKPGSSGTYTNNGNNTPMDYNIMRPAMSMIPVAMIMHPMVVIRTMNPSPMNTNSNGAKGTLRIGSRPRSIVYIDGSKKGWTPKRIKLSPGRHRITLINNDKGLRKSFSVKINSGKTTTKIVRF